MKLKKINRMHYEFGIRPETCKECSNLCKVGKNYKCRVYGISKSDATDWRLKYRACGMFCESYEGEGIRDIQGDKIEAVRPLKGQIEMILEDER